LAFDAELTLKPEAFCRSCPVARTGLGPTFRSSWTHCGNLSRELRKAIGTSNFMILVPLFYLTGLNEIAAGDAGLSIGGTSEPRGW